jgi:[ribosomal protein S5]-alanine N-acetyltransferase
MTSKRSRVPKPRLVTKRLVLMVPEPSDAARLLDYARRNDEPQRPWSPPTPPDALTLRATRERIRFLQSELSAGARYSFWLRRRQAAPGPFVGAITLSNLRLGVSRAANVGYHLDHEWVGKGLMAEALAALIRFAFDELHLHRLEASFMPQNERSARVLERAGFEVEGYARKYLFIAGQWHDHVLTSLRNRALDDPKAFLALG